MNKKISLFLRSVDGTKFYCDEFAPTIEYTLFGQTGDQVRDDFYNRHIIKGNEAYLYKVSPNKKHTWFGKMIMGKVTKMNHPDRNGETRMIYRVQLTHAKKV